MRILTGLYKGRSIQTQSDTSYRPTQSRIRKSLFDILGPLEGYSFCDLYAGSGIIGFEAASRGADHVTFVENDRKTLKLLNLNEQQLITTDCSIIQSDVLSFIGSSNDFDIIFADPPYACTELEELIKLGCDKRTYKGRFILETRTGAKIPLADDIRTYGDTQLHFWKQ